MKILVIIHEYPPIGGGGGKIARDLSIEWVKNGHEVTVLTAKYGDLPDTEDDEGVKIIRLDSNRKESFRAKMGAMAGFVLAASKYCLEHKKELRPDIIHVHFAVPNGPVAMLASKWMKVPYVITAHLGDIPGASPEKTKTWFKYIFPFTHPIWKRAANVVAVSEFSRKKALESYNVPIEVIPNGIDYKTIRNPELVSHDVPTIVFAGRFVPQKNLPQIIRVLSKIKELPWKCILIGDGQEKETILKMIRDADMENRFSLPGWKSPEEVIETFHHSDILFLPSTTEGLPVVGIQAMASGLALILSNAGGNPEIIHESVNGRCHDPEDTDAFVKDIKNLLENPKSLFEMRKNSLQLAESFDIKAAADAYIQSFQNVIGKEISPE